MCFLILLEKICLSAVFSKMIFLFISSKLACFSWIPLRPDLPQGVWASHYLCCFFFSSESHWCSNVEIPVLVKAVPDVKYRIFFFFSRVYYFHPEVVLRTGLAWDISFWGCGLIFKPAQLLGHKSIWLCVLLSTYLQLIFVLLVLSPTVRLNVVVLMSISFIWVVYFLTLAGLAAGRIHCPPATRPGVVWSEALLFSMWLFLLCCRAHFLIGKHCHSWITFKTS